MGKNANTDEIAVEAAESKSEIERLKAELIKANVRAEEAESRIAEMAMEEADSNQSNDGLVEIRLFKDGNRYKDDVFVCVNGHRMQIQRGKTVKIPKAFADVLMQSAEMDTATAELMTLKEKEFEEETQRRNL